MYSTRCFHMCKCDMSAGDNSVLYFHQNTGNRTFSSENHTSVLMQQVHHISVRYWDVCCCISDLWPGSCPPLRRAGADVTGPAVLWTFTRAVFGVNGSVGAVLERLHALNHTSLISQFPTGFTARSPLLYNPPEHTHIKSDSRLQNCTMTVHHAFQIIKPLICCHRSQDESDFSVTSCVFISLCFLKGQLTRKWKLRTHMGWLQLFVLQRFRMGLGFLLTSQKFLWTNRPSLFLRQPYLVYWTPDDNTKGHCYSARVSLRGVLSCVSN